MAPRAERARLKLLLDEMLSAHIAEQLRERGHDVLAVVERPDWRGLDDMHVFERAQAEERVIVTYNRDDFLALDRSHRAQGKDHCGIVIVHPRRFHQGKGGIGALVKSLEGFLSAGRPYPAFVHWLR